MSNVNIRQEKKHLEKLKRRNPIDIDALPEKERKAVEQGMALEELKLKVSQYDDRAYQITSNLHKMCGKDLADEFQTILWSIKEINDRHVGDFIENAEIVLYSDEKTMEITKNLLAWTEQFCASRILKSKSRNEDEFKKFGRLTQEAYNLFFTLTTIDPDLPEKFDNIHRVFVRPFKQYIGWYCYHATFGKLIKVDYQSNKIEYDEQIPEHFQQACFDIFEMYSIGAENMLNNLFSGLSGFLLPADYLKNRNTVDKINFLKEIIYAIREMRYYLLKNYSREKCKINLDENIHLFWEFGLNDIAGEIIMYRSENNTKNIASEHFVSVNHDGLFECHPLHWLTTLTLQDELKQQYRLEPLDINIYIMEQVHDKLFSLYDKIDFDKIQQKAKQKLTELQGVKTQVLEEESGCLDDDIMSWLFPRLEKMETDRLKESINIPRVNTLLKTFEEKLGCEVKKSKGSEITIYRKQSGKQYTIGHHKKNHYVPMPVIRNILKRLKISDREWIEAFM